MDRDDAQLTDWRARALALEDEVGRARGGPAARLAPGASRPSSRAATCCCKATWASARPPCCARSRACSGGAFARIEGTIDLMPSDLIYYTYINEDGRPAVEPGPLIRHGEDLAVFFFNEINRARPQVHSLLLRAMAERSVAAFNREYRFPHLLVFADRNRVEREETFEIAAAARDRFMMEITIDAPADDARASARWRSTRASTTPTRWSASLAPAMVAHPELNAMSGLIQRRVQASEALQQYALALWRATAEPARFGVRLPASTPRR